MLSTRRGLSAEALVSLGFSLVLASAPTLLLLIYKMGGPGPSRSSARLVFAFVLGFAALVIGLAVLSVGYRRSAGVRRRRFWIPLLGSALVAVVAIGAAEIALRLTAHRDPLGVRVGTLPLVPYDWKAVADTNRAHLDRFRAQPVFFVVEDSVLGWTVPPDRESQDGMYRSSEDGVRTGARAEALHAQTMAQRVLLFGDSFTFSMEVPFEESFGHFLASDLPRGTQVLNFGVDGYGVDQAYLRFRRSAPKWASNVVVLGFIQDDLYRAVSVYPFLRGWEYSFQRPRFVVEHDSLRLLNVPVMTPDTLFGKRSIRELPLLDRDVFFDPEHWTSHPLDALYLVRLAMSVFPRWPVMNRYTSDAAVLDLATHLLQSFVRDTRSLGAEPIIVYLPSRNDFGTAPFLMKGELSRVLARSGLTLHDMTPCLTRQVPASDLFLEGRGHYNAKGNAALAHCVEGLVTPYLR